jgi:ribose transport system permease protein
VSTIQRVGRSSEVSLLLLIAASWAVYGVLGDGFLGSFNLFTLSQLAASYAVIGFAQLVVLATGRMNMAVGAVGVIVAMFTGWLVSSVELPIIVGCLLGILLGTLAGALMGWLVLVTKLDSFIVTIAMLSIFTGTMYVLTKATPINLPPAMPELGIRAVGLSILSVLVVPALLIAVVLWFLYNRTSMGWKMLAVGANEKAASASGVRVPRVVIGAFALSGLLCAVAGLMETVRFGAALPNLGEDWILPAFVIPVLGGTALRGGSVSIVGTLLGAVFLMSIGVGMVSMNLPTYWTPAAQGVVLLAAVVWDEQRRRRRHKIRPQAPDGKISGRKRLEEIVDA